MPAPTIIKGTQLYQEFQALFAVIFGMVVQFVFGDSKTWRMFFLIFVSSLFIAVYVMPSFIDLIDIKPDGNFAITLYALSSLMSMEILAILISVLPRAIKGKVSKFLGVPDGKLTEKK